MLKINLLRAYIHLSIGLLLPLLRRYTMSTPTSIGFIHEALSLMEEYFKRKESSRELERITINKKSSYVAFLSIGNPSVRARVFTESAKNIEQLFQKFRKRRCS